MSQTLQEELLVAVSEACTNVVRHASDGGLYRLTVDIDDSHCRIEVRDGGPGFDPDAPGHMPPGRGGGRGLVLIRALVDDVWFEQRRPGVTVTMIKGLHRHADGAGGSGRQ